MPFSIASVQASPSRYLLNFYQGLQNETRMEVIDERALSVVCVIPRAIGVLALDDEVQIPFRRSPEFLVRKILRGTRQQKRPIGVGINDANRLLRVRSI